MPASMATGLTLLLGLVVRVFPLRTVIRNPLIVLATLFLCTSTDLIGLVVLRALKNVLILLSIFAPSIRMEFAGCLVAV